MKRNNQCKLLIVYDVGPPHCSGWAQYRHAEGLSRYSPKNVTVHIVPLGTYLQQQETWLSQYAAVYVISLYHAQPRKGIGRLAACVASHAWTHKRLDKSDWRTYGVNKDRCHSVGAQRLRGLYAAVCRNEALGKWARSLGANVAVIPAGVDCEIFKPGEFRHDTKRLRVGWCGQLGGITSFKGYDEVLQPLRHLFQQYDWRVNTRTHENAYSAERMADWYRSLDVFVCTSSAEGTPNPAMEAAACGVPVVATDVGQLADWDDLRETGMIVPDWGNQREAQIVVNKIAGRLTLLEEPAVRRECRERLLQSVADRYDYRVVTPETLNFLLAGIKKPVAPVAQTTLQADAARWDYMRRRLTTKRRDAKGGKLWRFEPLRNYHGDTVDEAMDKAIADEQEGG